MKKLKDIFKSKKKAELLSLNKLHFVFAGLYTVQAILLLVLGKGSSVPITTNYLAYDPLLSSTGEVVHSAGTSLLFNINLAWVVAAMLFVSAIGHVVFTTIYKKRYQAQLKKSETVTRWVTYGVISSFMMAIVAILSGVYDISSLLLIIAVSLFAAAFGIVTDLWARGSKKMSWFAPVNAIKAAIIPWLVIAIYVWGTFVYGGNSITAFVYWIYLTILLAQVAFVFVLTQQYKKQGNWTDTIYTERALFVLLFVVQTVLAWQVFFGTLR